MCSRSFLLTMLRLEAAMLQRARDSIPNEHRNHTLPVTRSQITRYTAYPQVHLGLLTEQ